MTDTPTAFDFFDPSRCDEVPSHCCDCRDCDPDGDHNGDLTEFEENGQIFIQYSISGTTWAAHETNDGWTYELVSEGE